MDIRVSSLPAAHGEVVVMRLMNMAEKLLSIDELGFSKTDAKKFRELIHRPAGMMVLCGPVNSGKTSSLYAALSELNTPERNLVTLEDPIERMLAGVNQVHIHPQAGLTYVAGLRAVLRQDVTGILLGEIRDEETAAMAVRIALTGHLLMTTIHTENAVAVIYRLLEMGIAPYLLSATLSGIVSQRLVRRLCPYCREVYAVRCDAPEALPCGRRAMPMRRFPCTGAAVANIVRAQAISAARCLRKSSCRTRPCARASCRKSRGARWKNGHAGAA